MNAVPPTSCINISHTDTNVASQACSLSSDKKLIDSNHSTEIRNGDYSNAKQNVFTAPSRIHNSIITMGDEMKKQESEEMVIIR